MYIVSETSIIQLHSATAPPKENTQVPKELRYPKIQLVPSQSLSLISHLQSLFKESPVNLPNKAPESFWLFWAPNSASSAEASLQAALRCLYKPFVRRDGRRRLTAQIHRESFCELVFCPMFTDYRIYYFDGI